MGLVSISEGMLQKTGIKNPKPIVYGVIIISGIVITVLAVRQVKKFFGKYTKPVDKHPVVGHTTITGDDAKSIADRLWEYLRTSIIVTNKSITQLFDGYPSINTADKIMIYNAFGLRNDGFPFYTEGDLYFWLQKRVMFGVSDAKEFWGI